MAHAEVKSLPGIKLSLTPKEFVDLLISDNAHDLHSCSSKDRARLTIRDIRVPISTFVAFGNEVLSMSGDVQPKDVRFFGHSITYRNKVRVMWFNPSERARPYLVYEDGHVEDL